MLNTWNDSESVQIKNIHKCYQQAYSDNDNDDVDDVEKFLPFTSPLRSKGGSKKSPLNVPYKDFKGFQETCKFDHWKTYFVEENTDKLLTEAARGIVETICTTQSSNPIRSFKRIVLNGKKREHITPLALVLHEIKDWCVNFLRIADFQHEDTFTEIKKRREYLTQLGNKEVWGDLNVAQDRQAKVFSIISNTLEKPEMYCYRGYWGKSSREKLKNIGDALKDLVLNEMRVLSARFELEHRLGHPKTARLQPIYLLNSVENIHVVDFKNPVNVLLYKVVQGVFVEDCIIGEFKTEVNQVIKYLESWSEHNLFCQQGSSPPVFLMENKKKSMMPAAYSPAAKELKTKLRKYDPKTPIPDPSRRVTARLKACFEKDEAVTEIIKNLMICLAAIQDLIPSLYVVHKLWTLAGEVDDFNLYDNLREHIIRVMDTIMKKTKVLRKASKKLKTAIRERVEWKEKELKKYCRRRKMVYKPNWLINHYWIITELSPNSKRNYETIIKTLSEVGKGAKDYTLTADFLSDKIVEAKVLFDAFVGVKNATPVFYEEKELIPLAVPVNSKGEKYNY